MPEKTDDVSEEECTEILHKIFADAQALLSTIAPDGWKNSEYVHLFHPTPEQQLTAYNRISDNLARLNKKKQKPTETEPYKTLSDFQMDNVENVNEHDEFLQALGEAVWDIFSNNHEVVAEDNRIYNLGSFRGSGDTIAEHINKYYPRSEGKLDYMDFYMGSIWIGGGASMLPFYKYIFGVLKKYNCDWHYSFPKLGLVNLGDMRPENTNPAEYDPWQALREEMSDEKSEVDKLQEELDNIYEQEYENAKYKPLPLTVQAYREVYGILPEGHPQKEFE